MKKSDSLKSGFLELIFLKWLDEMDMDAIVVIEMEGDSNHLSDS